MPHIATWKGPDGWRIFKTGTPLSEGGDGVAWRCTCPRGEPKTDGYPCAHLTTLFRSAREGRVSSRMVLTPAGERAAEACECITRAQERGEPEPRKEPQPEPEREGPARNRPCPCGSGRKYKKCHGAEGAEPLPAEPPTGGQPPAPPEPPEVPPEDPKEKRRRKRAENKAEREEIKVEKNKRLDEILARERAKDEARRKRDRARREKKKREKEGAK